jgi:hypothetical protein
VQIIASPLGNALLGVAEQVQQAVDGVVSLMELLKTGSETSYHGTGRLRISKAGALLTWSDTEIGFPFQGVSQGMRYPDGVAQTAAPSAPGGVMQRAPETRQDAHDTRTAYTGPEIALHGPPARPGNDFWTGAAVAHCATGDRGAQCGTSAPGRARPCRQHQSLD